MLHSLLSNFLDMVKKDIQFWISQSTEEVEYRYGTQYIALSDTCGLGCGLNDISYADANIFNATWLLDMLNSYMKQLKASSNFEAKGSNGTEGTVCC